MGTEVLRCSNITRSLLFFLYLYFCIGFDGVVIAAQWSATFSHLLCSPKFGYYDVNMPVKFCSEAYFFRLEVLKEAEISDPQLKVPPGGLGSEFLRPEKIHRPQPDLNLRTLDLEANTLPRDHRDWLVWVWIILYHIITISSLEIFHLVSSASLNLTLI